MPKAPETDAPLLTVGQKAPSFSLPASLGATQATEVSLESYAGKWLVVVFYPKDQTPGCTRQLCALQDDLARFQALGAEVLGSNPGSLASHQRFSEKQGYQFPIAVDADKTMAGAYGALSTEAETGKHRIARSVYVINPEGVIAFAQRGMPSDETLLAVIQA
ncbi:MAG: peroxiredoxin [Vampirovibrionales bacterium]